MPRIGALLGLLLIFCACGDNDGPSGPETLVPDPAVETGCNPQIPAAGSSRAKLVACAEEIVFDPDSPGLLVAARIGDILLENSEVKVVIRGFGAGYVFPGTSPGGIVDAARQGNDDAIKELIPLAELTHAANDELVIVEAGDDGPAEVVVRGPSAPIPLLSAAVNTAPVPAIVETRYILEPDSDVVRIQTRLFEDDSGQTPTVQIGEVFFFSGASTAFIPNVGQPAGLGAGEFIVSAGGTTSYAVAYPAETAAVQFLDIANVTGALGPQKTVGNPDPIERFLIIGDGSVGSVAERAWELRGVDTGTVSGTTAPGVDIVVRAGGNPTTIGRSDESGAFRVAAPVGSYEVTAESVARSPGQARTAMIAAGADTPIDLVAGGSGSLALTVADGAGAALVARATVTGVSRRIHYSGPDGILDLDLPPGSYTLDVSRGVEYDAFTVDPLVIVDGQTESVTATLDRVVDTAGWIAIDTHIHSEMSLDSSVPLAERLRSIAAEGIEIALSTDHDFVTDYGPVIEHLGLEEFLAYKAGVETSSFGYGHINAWPLAPDYDRAAGGAFEWYDLGPDGVFQLMRDTVSDIVIQVNHPRSGSSGYFELIDYDPDVGRALQDPAVVGFPGSDFNDLNFDAVEVANDFNDEEFATSFDDWLSLVAIGHPAAATGSSDSHGKSAFIGNSRTYVFVGAGNDTPGTVDLAAVDQAIKQRKVVVSQGAFVTAGIEVPGSGAPAEPGAIVDLSGQTEAVIHVKVQAPPWMPLSRIRVFAGRTEALARLLDPKDTAAVRFDDTITVPIASADGFFAILVEPAGPGSPVLGNPVGSFTNALLFDGDGDGTWTP